MVRTLFLAVGISLLWVSSAAAGEILLKNGGVIRGRIVSETHDAVVVDIRPASTNPDAHVRMTIKKNRIRKITREGDGRGQFVTVPGAVKIPAKPPQPVVSTPTKQPPLPTKQPPPPDTPDVAKPPTQTSPATPADGTVPTATGGESKEKAEYFGPKIREEEIDPAILARVAVYVEGLKTDNEKLRADTESRLVKLGADAAPSLALAVLGKHRQQRSAAARVLGNLRGNGKEGVLALVDQMTQSQQEKHFMRLCFYALKEITSQSHFFQQDKTLRKRKHDQRKWLEWFARVETKYPVQAGFAIDEDAWAENATRVAAHYKKTGVTPRPVQWVTKKGYSK